MKINQYTSAIYSNLDNKLNKDTKLQDNFSFYMPSSKVDSTKTLKTEDADRALHIILEAKTIPSHLLSPKKLVDILTQTSVKLSPHIQDINTAVIEDAVKENNRLANEFYPKDLHKSFITSYKREAL